MTSMKKMMAVMLMVVVMVSAIFAEAHKKQKIVWMSASLSNISNVSVIGDKATIRDPKTVGVAVPDGWHVVHMWVEDVATQKYFILVIEEN